MRFKIDLSPVPEGTYKALVVADCGGDSLFGATYTLQLGRPAAEPAPAPSQDAGKAPAPAEKR